jgi:serine/threonine protein kinase
VDWWCLGAVLYEMLYGLPPFYSRNRSEMYDRIVNKPLRLRPPISASARDILVKVCTVSVKMAMCVMGNKIKRVCIPRLLFEVWPAGLFPTVCKWTEMQKLGTFIRVIFGSIILLIFLCIMSETNFKA